MCTPRRAADPSIDCDHRRLSIIDISPGPALITVTVPLHDEGGRRNAEKNPGAALGMSNAAADALAVGRTVTSACNGVRALPQMHFSVSRALNGRASL